MEMRWVDQLEKLALWHQVSSARFLGPVRFRQLWRMYGDDIGRVFHMSDGELSRIKGVFNRQSIEGIRDQASKYQHSLDFMKRQLERAAKHGGSIVALGDPQYPEFLANSNFSHAMIYCIGDLAAVKDNDKVVAIVGTRYPAAESCEFARRIARELARCGWIVASGMAKGIDAEAHRGALEADGKTIAVLGCGPDVIYPRESAELHRDIARQGLLLSEFPFGERVDELKLKKRNKTIVATSRGVLLVESDVTGGAMNAVATCREQKKILMTILPEWPCQISGNHKAANEDAFIVPIGPDSHSRIVSLLESPLPGLTANLPNHQ